MNTGVQALGNIAGLQRAVDESDFDAILIVSPENLCYAANAQLSSQLNCHNEHAFRSLRWI